MNPPSSYYSSTLCGSIVFVELVTLLSLAATPTPSSARTNGHTSSSGGSGIDSGQTPAYFNPYATTGIRAATVVFQLAVTFLNMIISFRKGTHKVPIYLEIY
jgi:ABC-type oligopeptide transport system substrate-binding subunit